MKSNTFIWLYLAYLLSTPCYANSPLLDIDVINEYFNQFGNGKNDNRPFKLEEIEALFSDLGYTHPYILESPKTVEGITKRYLDLSYPNPDKTANISDVVNSSLPKISKDIILAASEESVVFEISIDDVFNYDNTLLSKINSFYVKNTSVTASAVEGILLNRYSKNIFYRAYTPMIDSDKKKFLHSSPNNDHFLSEILKKMGPIKIHFTAKKCENSICKSSDGKVFSSFLFDEKDFIHIKPEDSIFANCVYDGISRSEYSDIEETKIAFNKCRLVSVNGKTPFFKNKLMERLYQ